MKITKAKLKQMIKEELASGVQQVAETESTESLAEASTALGFEELLNTFLEYQQEYEGTSAEEMARALKKAWSQMSDKIAGEPPITTDVMTSPPPQSKKPPQQRSWLKLFKEEQLRQIIKQTLQEMI